MTVPTEINWTTTKSLEDLTAWTKRTLIPVLQDWGFKEEWLSPRSLLLVRKRSPWPVAFISVIAFWLSPSRKEQIVVSFAPAGMDRTRMTVTGDVPHKIATTLRELPNAEVQE